MLKGFPSSTTSSAILHQNKSSIDKNTDTTSFTKMDGDDRSRWEIQREILPQPGSSLSRDQLADITAYESQTNESENCLVQCTVMCIK